MEVSVSLTPLESRFCYSSSAVSRKRTNDQKVIGSERNTVIEDWAGSLDVVVVVVLFRSIQQNIES